MESKASECRRGKNLVPSAFSSVTLAPWLFRDSGKEGDVCFFCWAKISPLHDKAAERVSHEGNGGESFVFCVGMYFSFSVFSLSFDGSASSVKPPRNGKRTHKKNKSFRSSPCGLHSGGLGGLHGLDGLGGGRLLSAPKGPIGEGGERGRRGRCVRPKTNSKRNLGKKGIGSRGNGMRGGRH